MRLMKLTFLVVLIAIIAGCSSTSIQDAWQNPTFKRDQLKKVFVVGLSPNTNQRLVFERDFSNALREFGVDAVSSGEVLGSELPTKETVLKFVDYEKINYVMVTYLDKVVENERYVQPTVSLSAGVSTYPYYGRYPHPYYPSFNSMWGPGGAAIVSTPGYVKKTTNTILVTSIYDVSTGEIVWTASTSTFQENSVSKMSQEVAEVVWKNIMK